MQYGDPAWVMLADMLTLYQKQWPTKNTSIYSASLVNHIHMSTLKFTENSEMVRSISNDSKGRP